MPNIQPYAVVVAVLVAAILLGRVGRALGLASPEEQAWRSSVDLPLGLGCGIGGAWLMSFWMVPRVYEGYPVWASSFLQYCTIVGCQAQRGYLACLPYHDARSPAAGWPAGLLASQIGTMEAMTWYALLSVWVLCFGLFLWARIIHGRTAGVAAALLASCVSPLIWLSRDLSFLPVKHAFWVLTAACVAALFRYEKSWKPALITGLVCGIAFQLHFRGITIGFALLGAAILAAILRADTVRRGVLRLTLLLVPLGISWFASSITVPEPTCLVCQVYRAFEDGAAVADLREEFLSRYERDREGQGLPTAFSEFRWGKNSPGEMITMFRQLMAISRALPAKLLDHPEFVAARNNWVLVWVPGLALAFLVSCWRLRKRRWQLLALLATGAPYVLLAWSALKMLPHIRFYTYGAALVPLLLGVGIGAALEHSRPSSPKVGWRRWPVVSLIAVIALAIAVLSAGPLFLESTRCQLGDGGPSDSIREVYAGGPFPQWQCQNLLLEELQQGIDIQPRLYGKKGLIDRGPW